TGSAGGIAGLSSPGRPQSVAERYDGSGSRGITNLPVASYHRGATRRLTVAAICALFAAGCALNRGQVKALRDPAAVRIQFDSVIDTTISELNALPSRCWPAGNGRVR